MNPDLGAIWPGMPAPPGMTDGDLGAIDRSIGAAVEGAVRVEGGGEYVLLPRLPMEPPPPSLASAKAGASTRAATAAAVRRREPRPDMVLSLCCGNERNLV
jgi:hypothetical protein